MGSDPSPTERAVLRAALGHLDSFDRPCGTCGHRYGAHAAGNDNVRDLACPKVDASASHEHPWRDTTFTEPSAWESWQRWAAVVQPVLDRVAECRLHHELIYGMPQAGSPFHALYEAYRDYEEASNDA